MCSNLLASPRNVNVDQPFPGGRNRRYVGRFPANGRVGLQCVSVPSDQLTKIEELLHSSNVDVAAVIEGLA